MTVLNALQDYDTIDRACMTSETARLFDILRAHTGRHNAIAMLDLYETWSGAHLPRDAHGKPEADVPTLSRHMRKLIDDLRDLHGVAVLSSSQHGYWLAGTAEELLRVCAEFRARGIKSLETAARLKRISVLDEIAQLELQLRSAP